ncbi:cytidine deaminase [Fulvivirga sedimenti]|uniref:Cytidine deaminase n=1 Tax=Fulvivirga sedimenti TaxID=2879465 RepID=A0A9X1KYJ7_9BACT|nr:cytidine deaminase [Fulvivirga sedimenti]MCA6077988.1 cytidine deaminase [Fulvivirga sedimenti]
MEQDKYTIIGQFDELVESDKSLAQAAMDALRFSYAPYSTFHVAAAIRLADGTVITGVNQENASSPAGLCAEQVALYRKGIEFPEKEITQIAIVARSGDKQDLVPVSPCGNCRQVMVEFLHRQEPNYSILMKWEGKSWIKIHQVDSLLPFSFTAKSR